MSRITIVVPDNLVIMDGVSHAVDCSSLAGVHALQWYGTSGNIEYELVDGLKQPNANIDNLDEFQSVLAGLI